MKKAKIVLLSLTLIGYLVAAGGFIYGSDVMFYTAVGCFTIFMVAFFIVAMIEKKDAMPEDDTAEEEQPEGDAADIEQEKQPQELMAENASEPEGIREMQEMSAAEGEIAELKAELAEAEACARILREELETVKGELAKQTEAAEAAEVGAEAKVADAKMSFILPEGLTPKEELSTINIVDIAKSVADELREPALRAGLRVQVSSSEESIMVRADEGLLRVLFRNIVDNSIKYMNRQGMLVITLSTIGDDLFVVLKDNGEGLPAEETGHIFELNYQGSNRISGNGLGLAQAKAVVTYYGGNIYAKSVKGGGMGIYIQLPTL